MKNKKMPGLIASASLMLGFALWTAMVSFVDLKPIGPNSSTVGLATLNGFFYRLFGSNMTIYTVTDWLGLVPVAFCLGFAIFGLVLLIKRRSILKVDRDILLLGGFYIIVILLYLFFEYSVINYRPVLINGVLEASYPSSTTLLVLTVMPTAIMQLNRRIRKGRLRTALLIPIMAFTLLMPVMRLVSGVHWFSDIVGGVLLSLGLVFLYRTLAFKN